MPDFWFILTGGRGRKKGRKSWKGYRCYPGRQNVKNRISRLPKSPFCSPFDIDVLYFLSQIEIKNLSRYVGRGMSSNVAYAFVQGLSPVGVWFHKKKTILQFQRGTSCDVVSAVIQSLIPGESSEKQRQNIG